MFRWVIFKRSCLYRLILVERLSTQETAAALRPFYFVVHPDLFGQHPRERAVNEESLKKLHEYITSLRVSGYARAYTLPFYVKPQIATVPYSLKRVQVYLSSKDILTTVTAVLNTFSLSLDYVNSLPAKSTNQDGPPDRPIDWHPSYYEATGKVNPNARKEATSFVETTLQSWLSRNVAKARTQVESVRMIHEDVERICTSLRESIGLADLRWESVWGNSHFRGCIKSFKRLYTEHPDRVGSVLKGRTLVFGNSTGVSALGEIVLSSEDVPTCWMTLLMAARAYESILQRLPVMEDQLSSLLNDIQIMRRTRRHSVLMAEEYELLLNKLLNSLRRCQGSARSKLFYDDLSHLQLVVEGESGPLMISYTGQFLVPAAIPGSIVIDFIAKHKSEADKILQDMKSCLRNEEQIIAICKAELELSSLLKDESVNPYQMIECCEKLLDASLMLGRSLKGLNVRISHYYSVMHDGDVCLPWNWKNADNS